MELNCVVQHYHWGERGADSVIARLLKCADPEFEIDENKCYAELWMGTHPNGPSVVANHNLPLGKWIEKNPSMLGAAVMDAFGGELPFLFKILSIHSPLSIQVHPTKAQAAALHHMYPDIYKDANHKPELCIALSEFEALCGFRPISEIKQFFKLFPELSDVIGADLIAGFMGSEKIGEKDTMRYLKKCFKALMKAPKDVIREKLYSLLRRLPRLEIREQEEEIFTLLSRVHEVYPGDAGCFCVFFFNYLILQPGEAIFIPANEPHAYIKGDCVECMARSDNVVRAGLTPKPVDVKTLCKILNYASAVAESKLLMPEEENEFSIVYKPPENITEFAVAKISLDCGQRYEMKRRSSASICVVFEGSVEINNNFEMATGQVFFLAAEQTMLLANLTRNEGAIFTMFQAFVNCRDE